MTIDATPRIPLATLDGQVSVASLTPGQEQQVAAGPITLPGTLVVLLPDVAEPATIALHAIANDGTTLSGAAKINTMPHQQVAQSVMLTPFDGGPVTPPPDMAAPPDTASPGPPPDMAPRVLAADDFQRTDQSGWGTASDGLVWNGDANNSNAFSVARQTGQIAVNTPTGTTVFQTASFGPSVGDADLLVVGSMSGFANGANASNNEMAAVVRYVSDNVFYKAGIDGANLRLFVRTTANSSAELVKVSFNATPNTSYTIRFRAVGTSLMAKAWPTAGSEPTSWMVTATDGSLAAGQCGVRMVFYGTATATFTSIAATAP